MIEPFVLVDPIDRHGCTLLPTTVAWKWKRAQVHRGCALAWTECERGVLLVVRGGGEAAGTPFLYEDVAFTLTSPGLSALIDDLRAIADRIEGAVAGRNEVRR